MSNVARLALPRNLVAAAQREGHQAWLTATLPAVVRETAREWSLRTGGTRRRSTRTAVAARGAPAGCLPSASPRSMEKEVTYLRTVLSCLG
jgi:hypothetical protein